MKNFYQVLGIEADASPEAIKASYRKLAMQFHPDRNPGDAEAEAKFKEISEAYDTLKDSKRRAQYDAELAYAGSPRRFQQQGPFTYTTYGGQGVDFDEILRDLHRGFGSRPSWQHEPRNKDVNLQYQITLEEAFTGKDVELQYRVQGKESRTVSFKIPEGIQDGTRLRFTGQGDDSIEGFPPGDLYIRIVTMPHPRFIRHGDHLATAIEIDYLDAILGTEVDVGTIEGKTIKLHVPAGIVPGQSLRAAGKGMGAEGRRGDLHIEVIINPGKLTEEQLDLIRQARDKVKD